MKRLYKKLSVTFLISSILIAMLFTLSLYKRSMEENCIYLHQLLDSANINLKSAKIDQQEKTEILENDYLNRAWAAEYILSNDYKNIYDNSGLLVIKELMEVENISVIDRYGKILMSTGDTAGFYENTEELEKLLSSEKEKAYLICSQIYDYGRDNSHFYILVKSQSENFSAVRIDAAVSRLGLMSEEDIIRSTLKTATTEYATSIFAVDKESGKTIGITENNIQQFSIDGVDDQNELLDFLKQGTHKEAFLAKIRGKISQMAVYDLGSIYLAAFSDTDKVFGSVTQTFLEGIAGIGGISVLTVLLVHYHIKNMEKELSAAKTEAKYDKLTGLYNRNGFEKCVNEFLMQDKPCGVLLLLDLDNFKKINDSEGHPEGDRVLQKLALCLKRVFRRDDSIGRLGGDEFIVLIQNELPKEILEYKLNRVLEEVRTMLGSYREKYGASVSIGAVPADGSVKSYDALYKYADAALYIAKYMGKNRFYINDKKISCAKEECSFYAADEKDKRNGE